VAEAAGASSLPLVCPRCRAPLAQQETEAVCTTCAARYPRVDGVLHLIAGRQGAPGFDPHYFETLAEVERRHFWFVSRRRVIVDALKRHVADLDARRLFDIGCGTGGLLEFLTARGVRLAGACDAYPESLALVRRRVDTPLVLVDEGRLPPLGGGQTLLSLFDVLEHMDDDLGMLRFLHSVLEPGGVLVLTVPAHPFLFDEMDELAHHRRRYRRSELQSRLRDAGFDVVLLTHFMAGLVPLLTVARTAGRLLSGRRPNAAARRAAEFRVVPVLNGLMLAGLGWERLWLRLGGSLPFGSSLLAVAIRPRGFC
jgi:SAM-dependent methyltransferase